VWRRLSHIAVAVGVAISFVAVVAPGAQAFTDPYDTPLSLVNGWTGAPFGTQQPGVKQSTDGIVTFTGAIAGGTTGSAFQLPANDWPAAEVYVPVDTYAATKGRLAIAPNGWVTVQDEGSFSNASQFTSLDGVSFALPSATSNSPLTLLNGWKGAPYSTGSPGVQLESVPWGFGAQSSVSVHLTGAIWGGSSSGAFVLPPGFRPSSTMYVPVDMYAATNGRLIISPNGTVSVQAESSFANAQNFTSLDGASFLLPSQPEQLPLTLANGWTAYGGGTAAPAVAELDSSTTAFIGAIHTSGTNPVAFTLPTGWAPPTDVFVSVDLCGATKGRLWIQSSGVVTVQAENGNFSNATCFTSLDGVSFSLWQNPPS
jgi:hypothetical protein